MNASPRSASTQFTSQAVAEPLAQEHDFLPLRGTDHVEFFVGNARQAAYFYRAAFGMSLVAYAGPETGQRDRASYVVQQGKIRFVLTTPLRSSDPDRRAYSSPRRRGARRSRCGWTTPARPGGRRPAAEPSAWPSRTNDPTSMGAWSAVEHPRLRRHHSHLCGARRLRRARFCPAFGRSSTTTSRVPWACSHIDHMVGNVGWHEMDKWVDFYGHVMGFWLYQHFDDKDISTEYSALMSKVMANGNGYVKFPINEPAEGKRKSQIEEYLDFYPGPGVQHIALATNDILHTVNRLHEQGIEFLRVPHTYYTELQQRVGTIDEPVDELEELGILVDRDDEGYMLQIFTRPVEDRPTSVLRDHPAQGKPQLRQGQLQGAV